MRVKDDFFIIIALFGISFPQLLNPQPCPKLQRVDRQGWTVNQILATPTKGTDFVIFDAHFTNFSPFSICDKHNKAGIGLNASNLKIQTLLIKHHFKLTWILFITYSPRKKPPSNTPFLSLHEHKINEFINLKVQSIFAKLQLSVKSISYSTRISLHVYQKFYITTGTNIYPYDISKIIKNSFYMYFNFYLIFFKMNMPVD